MSHGTRSLPPRTVAAADAEPDFVELAPSATAARPAAPTAARPRGTARAPRPPVIAAGLDEGPERTWSERLIYRLFGDEGAGYGISLVVHVILLAILAIPILQNVKQGPIFSTVVTEAEEQSSDFSEMIDTELSLPEELAGGLASMERPELNLNEAIPFARALFDEAGSIGEGEGFGDFDDGALQFVPKNAVTAGSFTAWTTPIAKAFGEKPEPGDSPRPGQQYWITIQIKVPNGRRSYPLSDLSGMVIGTDDYKQEIPYDRRSKSPRLFVVNKAGELVRPRSTVPVIDGVVQFRISVPGAAILVKDTIEISSRMLDESQTLELVFGEEE